MNKYQNLDRVCFVMGGVLIGVCIFAGRHDYGIANVDRVIYLILGIVNIAVGAWQPQNKRKN
jgi:hypothetical protein